MAHWITTTTALAKYSDTHWSHRCYHCELSQSTPLKSSSAECQHFLYVCQSTKPINIKRKMAKENFWAFHNPHTIIIAISQCVRFIYLLLSVCYLGRSYHHLQFNCTVLKLFFCLLFRREKEKECSNWGKEQWNLGQNILCSVRRKHASPTHDFDRRVWIEKQANRPMNDE